MTTTNNIQQKKQASIKVPLTEEKKIIVKKKTVAKKKTKLKTLMDNTLISIMMGASLSGGEFIGDKTAECFLKCKRKRTKEYPIRKRKKIVDEVIKHKEIKQKLSA